MYRQLRGFSMQQLLNGKLNQTIKSITTLTTTTTTNNNINNEVKIQYDLYH